MNRADSVVVANPGRQHVYQTVLAAQEGGLLRAFATGVYLGGGDQLSGLIRSIRRLPPAQRFLRSAPNRVHQEIDPERVVSFPVYPLLARAVRSRSKGVTAQRWALRRCDAAIARWLDSLVPRPALVHGFELGALATFRAARKRGVTTVLDVPMAHEYGHLLEGGSDVSDAVSVRVRAERELADYAFAPSEFVTRCLEEFGFPGERIVRIPYGADCPAGSPSSGSRDSVFRLLFVGSIVERKGVAVLLDAWKKLGLPGAELVLVGGAGSPAGREMLRGRSHSCTWAGLLPRHEVQRWYRQSDVFVLPSFAEGSALVTYEAMAFGLPVITTPNAGSVVSDGVEGFLVDAGDGDALAERILLLYTKPELRRELGRRARATIESGYTWAHYRQRVRAAYEAILEGRDPRSAVSVPDRPLEELVT